MIHASYDELNNTTLENSTIYFFLCVKEAFLKLRVLTFIKNVPDIPIVHSVQSRS